ncbi:hypothetical protein Patl1_12696 [Pistacia atlantica]|uniref:Uncharacterized protein n=1 Tax=Pistacia atlantica TaxID=434234 RepID=A0ACC1ASW3_9ROSI|nr:hypothetical protein Patl1_12696 [Pistacia atlantica]
MAIYHKIFKNLNEIKSGGLSNYQPIENNDDSDNGSTAISVIVTLVVFVIIGVISCYCAKRARRAITQELQTAVRAASTNTQYTNTPHNAVQVWEVIAPTMENFLQEMAREKPVRFTAQQLYSFTSNYSTRLGSGGFGAVYKGRFPNGERIAVKVLKWSVDKRAEEQFMAEVGTIGRTYHINLIIGRRKNASVGSTDSLDWFPKHVWEEYEKGELGAVTLACGIEEKDREKVERMSKVALWCVQDSPEGRPPMSAVVKMLEGGVEIVPRPKPFQYLFSVGMTALNPLETSDGSSFTTSEESQSRWYKETTPIMAKVRRAIVKDLGTVIVAASTNTHTPSNVIQLLDVTAQTMENFLLEMEREKPVRFTAQQLYSFTSSYSTRFGSGGFGSVIKGQFPNGERTAVKVLKWSVDRRAEAQFMAEVGAIGRTYHLNLVRLYGFCHDQFMRALVYEYMENGLLDKYLLS